MKTSAARGDTLSVVNWNMEWFGDASKHDPTVQTAGVRAMMKAMDADIYALCEVVNVDSLNSIVSTLPGNYGFEVSSYGSFASSPASGSYAGAQKLGFVYRKSLVRRVSTHAMLSASPTAYSSFASGRFPFLVNAEVMGKDSVWRIISFIVLHAKAYADATSCGRRIDGCHELKDSLDRYMPFTRFLLLGDFNDDLDMSNCSSATESNYAYMLRDSLHYNALTLPISRAGAFSSDGYSSLIDHVIASDEMAAYYVPGSAEVLRPLAKAVDPAYDNDISDHFPMRTRYVMDRTLPVAITSLSAKERQQAYPNPAHNILYVTHAGDYWKAACLVNMQGRLVVTTSFDVSKSVRLGDLPAGIYLLRLTAQDGTIATERVVIR